MKLKELLVKLSLINNEQIVIKTTYIIVNAILFVFKFWLTGFIFFIEKIIPRIPNQEIVGRIISKSIILFLFTKGFSVKRLEVVKFTLHKPAKKHFLSD